LGIQLDTTLGIASIPEEKIRAYGQEVERARGAKAISVKELKSITGKLSFTCCVITTGRCFLRRLYDKGSGNRAASARVSIDAETADDLEVWSKFLRRYNGRTLLSFSESATSADWHMYSDSSKKGYGATFKDRYIVGTFPDTWREYDIQVLELYPIFLLVNVFKCELRNRKVMFHSDNISVVLALKNQTSKNRRMMKLLRHMILLMLDENIKFTATHIPGVHNTICDALSRGQVPPAWLQRQGLRGSPEPIPNHLRPHNFELQ